MTNYSFDMREEDVGGKEICAIEQCVCVCTSELEL